MERFTRECLELDIMSESTENAAARMEKVYERASRLIRKTLDVDGAVILDLSQFESIETIDDYGETNVLYQAETYNADGKPADFPNPEEEFVHAPDYDPNTAEQRLHSFGPIGPWTMLGASERTEVPSSRMQPLSATDHAKFSDFLRLSPDGQFWTARYRRVWISDRRFRLFLTGRIYEHVVPTWIRHFLPPALQYALSKFPTHKLSTPSMLTPHLRHFLLQSYPFSTSTSNHSP
jgi:hypothetical protein